MNPIAYMRKFDTIKDCDGNKIQSGDSVHHKCKIDSQYKKGIIHHMVGGSFAIEGDRYRTLYNYSDVKPYSIRKTSNESKKKRD
jgi:hypothetical protein